MKAHNLFFLQIRHDVSAHMGTDTLMCHWCKSIFCSSMESDIFGMRPSASQWRSAWGIPTAISSHRRSVAFGPVTTQRRIQHRKPLWLVRRSHVHSNTLSSTHLAFLVKLRDDIQRAWMNTDIHWTSTGVRWVRDLDFFNTVIRGYKIKSPAKGDVIEPWETLRAWGRFIASMLAR